MALVGILGFKHLTSFYARMRAQHLFDRALSTRDPELAQALWSDGVDFLCQAYQTDANAAR